LLGTGCCKCSGKEDLKKYKFFYKNIFRVFLEFRKSEEFNFLAEEIISRASLDKSL